MRRDRALTNRRPAPRERFDFAVSISAAPFVDAVQPTPLLSSLPSPVLLRDEIDKHHKPSILFVHAPDVGVISGAIKYIQADFGLSTLQKVGETAISFALMRGHLRSLHLTPSSRVCAVCVVYVWYVPYAWRHG